ncbi:MAG: GMC family oxidoreductase N-terminal domain-containing protein [Bradymonadia bacterium]
MNLCSTHSPSRRLLRWLTALAEILYSNAEFFPAPIDRAQFQVHVNRQWQTSPWHIRIAIQCIAFTFQWTALLRYLRPFSALPLPAQERWLEAWTTNKIPLFRLSVRLLLTFVKPAYFQQVNVQNHLKYSRPIASSPAPESMPLPIPSPPPKSQHQVLIIGTGAGGAVLGASLAEAGLDVAFIEAGQWHTSEQFRRPPLESLRKSYLDGGLSIAYGRPNIPLPQGMTVGGSTTINSGTCFRIPEYVSNKLVQAKTGLSNTVLAPHYDAIEKRLSVKPVGDHLLGGSSHVIARGAEALGLKHGPLRRNIAGCQRSAQCAFGCPTEAKQSMHLTYLPDALRHGATLYDNTLAERVIFEGRRAVGVDVYSKRTNLRTRISADLIVSACGTIGTVPLLKRSGIQNPHLGRHLSIHPASKITALMPEAIEGWHDTPQGYGIFDLMDEGILFEGAFVPPEYGVVSLPFVGQELGGVMSNYDKLAIFGLFVADGPNGRVRVLPNGRPLVSYWLSNEDAARFQHGLSLLSKVFFAGGAETIFLPIAGREKHSSLQSALATIDQGISPWDLELVAFHPLGTARMSPNADAGVIKPTGEVWGRERLFVSDGSVFPTSLGVNPQLTIMATARHIAQRILAEF